MGYNMKMTRDLWLVDNAMTLKHKHIQKVSSKPTGCFKKVPPPPKTCRNIFISVKSFCKQFSYLLAIHIHIYLSIFVDLS